MVSRSNAVGLMQIKAATAGREVYRAQGRHGQPSNSELRDPAKNIDIGAAYIRILQDSALAGIRDPRRCAMPPLFPMPTAPARCCAPSRDRDRAIAMINAMTPDEFYQHVQNKHPAARRRATCGKSPPPIAPSANAAGGLSAVRALPQPHLRHR